MKLSNRLLNFNKALSIARRGCAWPPCHVPPAPQIQVMDLLRRLFRLPSARKPRPIDELAKMVETAWTLLDQVPDPGATLAEVRQAVPYQNLHLLDLVSQVILGMEAGGQDFADYPIGPAALREQEIRACHYRVLANIFAELHRCCRTCAHLEQAELAKDAIQVLRYTAAGVRRARPDPLDRRRADHLYLAFRALRLVFGRGRGRQRKA
jgi:hypothetical protein